MPEIPCLMAFDVDFHYIAMSVGTSSVLEVPSGYLVMFVGRPVSERPSAKPTPLLGLGSRSQRYGADTSRTWVLHEIPFQTVHQR